MLYNSLPIYNSVESIWPNHKISANFKVKLNQPFVVYIPRGSGHKEKNVQI